MVGSAILHTQAERIFAHVQEIRINKSVISYIIHTYLFSRILNLKGFGSWIETKLFIRKIKKIAPDIIHLHNIHQNFLNLPLLFSFLKKRVFRLFGPSRLLGRDWGVYSFRVQ